MQAVPADFMSIPTNSLSSQPITTSLPLHHTRSLQQFVSFLIPSSLEQQSTDRVDQM